MQFCSLAQHFVQAIDDEVGVVLREAHRRLEADGVAVEAAFADRAGRAPCVFSRISAASVWRAPSSCGRARSSTPSIRPRPRTSPMSGVLLLQLQQAVLEIAADLAARSAGCPRASITSSVARPCVMLIGLPPKVLKWTRFFSVADDLAAWRHGAERRAVADALGHRHHVGRHAPVLKRPVVMRPCGRSRPALRRRCTGRRAGGRCRRRS